jgi:hypothetical protein
LCRWITGLESKELTGRVGLPAPTTEHIDCFAECNGEHDFFCDAGESPPTLAIVFPADHDERAQILHEPDTDPKQAEGTGDVTSRVVRQRRKPLLWRRSGYLPYAEPGLRKVKLALRIGSQYEVRHIGRRNWADLAKEVPVKSADVLSVVERVV